MTEATEQAKVYESLSELVTEQAEQLKDPHKRVYSVRTKRGKPHFTVSNSPGNAAQAVCEVKSLTQAEVTQACFDALTKSHKAGLAGADAEGDHYQKQHEEAKANGSHA